MIATVLAFAAASSFPSCGAAPDPDPTGPLTVYVSVPLRGPAGENGLDIADGAELALERADGMAGDVETEIEVLDDTEGPPDRARWSPAAVAANARAASEDTSAIAYIGDFESGATRVSLPITNQAMVPQVSPASTALDLVAPAGGGNEVPELVQPTGERSFVRVIPDDRVQAEAAAAWARRLGVQRATAVSDGSEFGDQVVEEFTEEAEGLGIELLAVGGSRRASRRQTGLLYYGGQNADRLILRLTGAAPDALLMSTDALLMDSSFLASAGELEPRVRLTASAENPEQLPPAGQDFVAAFEREYGRAPGPYAAYGYEAMALVLDAIERAGSEGEDRRSVLDALLDTTNRDSVLGTYSITATGDTTLDAIAGYRVAAGHPVFDRPLAAP